ncbi:MAG: galactose mutarotase [Eubacterium sp.]|nr:galactose mutarotase [Eubacterium sp.]
MSVTTSNFGTTKDGKEVTLYAIENKNGMKAEVIDYGANIVRLLVPDKEGKLDDVVLGFDDVTGYEVNGCFFGAFIGRHGNRIGDARFELNGVTYELEKNDGENNLHGGTPGYHQVMYEAASMDNSVTFYRVSPDMEQGYPGNLEISVTYTVTDDNELKISYLAKSDKDTLCNVTNHTYFNLKGHDGGEITDHKVWIRANGFTETTDDLIPNGNIVDVTGTPMDFREKKAIGDDIEADYKPLTIAGGYDHNYALDKTPGKVEKVAELSEETTGRTMEVYTDLPGMQLYTGNFIKKENGKNGTEYTKRTGVCFETQFFPNSVNVPAFDSCVLKAGDAFASTTIYRFC